MAAREKGRNRQPIESQDTEAGFILCLPSLRAFEINAWHRGCEQCGRDLGAGREEAVSDA